MVTHPAPILTNESRFPTELLLEVIERLNYGDGAIIPTLAKVHPRIRRALSTYETSLARNFARKEMRHALVDFPSEKRNFKWLQDCVRKYDVVDDLMAVLMSRDNVVCAEWSNMALVNTGILLLYRLQTFESHAAKRTFITSLSKDPLIAITLTLDHATRTALHHGKGFINKNSQGSGIIDATTISLQHDLEFAYAEAALSHGPFFLHTSFLSPCPSAEITLLNLYHEHAMSEEDAQQEVGNAPVTQGPKRSPETVEKSLCATLRERSAEVLGCPAGLVQKTVAEVTSGEEHWLAWLGMAGKKALMRGEDLVR